MCVLVGFIKYLRNTDFNLSLNQQQFSFILIANKSLTKKNKNDKVFCDFNNQKKYLNLKLNILKRKFRYNTFCMILIVCFVVYWRDYGVNKS